MAMAEEEEVGGAGPMSSLAAGATVRIKAPSAMYPTQAKFRGRLGVVMYPLAASKRPMWVVAVERHESERVAALSSAHAEAAENRFEFLALGDEQLERIGETESPPEKPEWIVRSFKRRRRDAGEDGPSSSSRGPGGRPKAERVGLIVPFRDAHASQQRAKHLAKFAPHYVALLRELEVDFRILIVEQSADGRKFNRGQLLNIGYRLAKDAGCDSFVFHDVDLLADGVLAPYYGIKPRPGKPLHLARVWDRYSGNPDYFGGAAVWNALDFEAINGFPNNYWGWGGEDDEMMRRCKTVFGDAFTMDAPHAGALQDLEDMDIDAKVNFLKQHSEWKCNVRWELRDEHADTWASNGLRVRLNDAGSETPFHFDLLQTTQLLGQNDTRAAKYTVQCSLHGDWTDAHAAEKPNS